MAEERTLGLTRIQEGSAEEPSKEELQRKMDEARESISQTVTEIKEKVANQVQAVKEQLDWREQYRRRPITFSAGAAGVGFLVGYGLAAIVKGNRYDINDYYAPESTRSYAAQPILSSPPPRSETRASKEQGNGHDTGPSFLQKLSHTPAYERVRHEVGNVGDAFIQELSKTAKLVVVPAVIKSIRDFIGDYLPGSKSTSDRPATMRHESAQSTDSAARYQPTLERGQ